MEAIDVAGFERKEALHLPGVMNLAKTQAGKGRKRILVIDDDTSILDTVKEVLIYAGYEVATCLNCDNVFDQIGEVNPDLILIDYLLNGINGGELCHQVKTNSSTEHIPVIMMSGFPKVFLSLGNYNCDVFITKPFSLEDLLEKVDHCLGRKSAD